MNRAMARRPQRRPVLGRPEPLRGLVGRVDGGGSSAGRPVISRDDWEQAVGPRIAERAQPLEVDRGTLIVRVATSVWASELSLLSVLILARLNARGMALQGLRCRVGLVEARVQPTALRVSRAVPPPAALPPAVEQALAAVADDELRAVIGAAASANLAWQDYVAGGTDGTTRGGSRAARVPQSAETESDRQDRTRGAAPATSPRKP